MPKNIETFNAMTTVILSRLYEVFPVELTLCSNDFELLDLPDEVGLDERVSEFIRLNESFHYTSKVLLREGYICGEMPDGRTFIYGCTLTIKGLQALQKVPNTLKANKKTIGELMRDVATDVLKDATKETVGILVKTALSS